MLVISKRSRSKPAVPILNVTQGFEVEVTAQGYKNLNANGKVMVRVKTHIALTGSQGTPCTL